MKRFTCLWFACLLPVAAAASAAPMYHLTTLATFDGTNGAYPQAGLLADASGNLYGTTQQGGDLTLNGGVGYGTVFEVAAGTHALSTLATFNGTNGLYPFASLISDADGNLFGTTRYGGGNSGGTVFELAAGTHALTTLVTFDNFNTANGAFPIAGLIADASGNLFGTTQQGGANGKGTVFEVDALTHSLSNLATFNGTNGAYPYGGLIADAGGNLYGTTQDGGANDRGTVFQVANDANHTLTTLATFDVANGRNPEAALFADPSGNMYGTTVSGGDLTLNNGRGYGTVFELANDANHTFSTLVTFSGTNGASPHGDLIADASGNLYGMTSSINGANSGGGTVFEVDAGTHDLTTLATFNGTNGSSPSAGLIADASGNLYSTTLGGGANRRGTVFELSPVPEPSSLLLVALAAAGLTTFALVHAVRAASFLRPSC